MLPPIFRDDTLRIETNRTWLRWPRPQDADAIHAYASIESVATMTATWPYPLAKDVVAGRIAKARAENVLGFASILVLTPKSRPDFVIGSIGAGPSPDEGCLEIGYMLHPDWQGRGIMSDAVATYVTVLFWTAGIAKVTAYIRTSNARSRRLLEKTGFSQTGTETMDMPARGPDIPVHRYALEREDWQRRSHEQWRRGRPDVRKCA